jgi:hypothetical protein
VFELPLDALRTLTQQRTRPVCIVFKVPAKIVGFDHAQGGFHDKARALYLALTWIGREIDQPSVCPRAAAPVWAGDDGRAAQLQQQLFNGLDIRLREGLGSDRPPSKESHFHMIVRLPCCPVPGSGFFSFSSCDLDASGLRRSLTYGLTPRRRRRHSGIAHRRQIGRAVSAIELASFAGKERFCAQ